MAVPPGLLDAAEAWVRHELKDHDASHSFDHVERVAKMAVRLAREEGLDAAAVDVVRLAALLHGALRAVWGFARARVRERAGAR